MNQNRWGDEENICTVLGISKGTLTLLRESEYLKEGTHWRERDKIIGTELNTNNKEAQSIIYHLSWCREVISIWESRDAKLPGIRV